MVRTLPCIHITTVFDMHSQENIGRVVTGEERMVEVKPPPEESSVDK